MNKVKWISKVFLMLSVVGFLASCGSVIPETFPTTINPTVQRLTINQVVSLNIPLSRQHVDNTELKLNITFSDPTIASMASGTSSVVIKTGDSWINVSVQGLKAGSTYVYAQIEGRREDERAKGQLVVSEK